MKIINIKLLNGPNFWSVSRHKLVVMQLGLEELEELPTNKIEGFSRRLETMFPSMVSHYCSENMPGGFFKRVREGTWMGHVVEHIALELQTLAGMDCGFGRTRSTKTKGVYNVVYNYVYGDAGILAGKTAVGVAWALYKDEPYDIELAIKALKSINDANKLGPSTQSIVDEAKKRRIPCRRISDKSFFQLGYGKNMKKVQATITSHTSSIAVDLACDKDSTKKVLESSGIPVPKGLTVRNLAELKLAIDQIGYPVVIKPNNGNQGKGATTNILDWQQASKAFDLALEFSSLVVVESFIHGIDYRALVINNRFVAAAKRTPPSVCGDGKSTLKELIDQLNADERRGEGHEKLLTKIKIDEALEKLLLEQNLDLESVLDRGEKLVLRTTANLSTGGTAENVTAQVHPENAKMFERVSKVMGLDICGIDVIAKSLEWPINPTSGAVIEVNAAPGFRMHLAPTIGEPINVAAPVLDMLYPEGAPSRIPIIAVTGTNGKTTTTRLIAHFARLAGQHVGYTTSDGVYIQDELIFEGDCTGPKSTEMVLYDPTVDFAVLECARGGILKAGLALDSCDIGIVTNVTADHLGLGDIHTLEEMALVKSVVPESVHKNGYAILNADNDYTFKMAEHVKSKVAFFTMDKSSPRLIKHCGNGGLASYFDNGYVYLRRAKATKKILHVKDIPLTFEGKAIFMIENVMAAVLAAFISDISIEKIREGLKSFVPSPQQTPGRMNLFKFRNFDLLIDYAHNPGGFEAIGRFLANLNAYPKVGVIAGVGDRRDEDIYQVGYLSGKIFDEVIIRMDKTLRGRKAEDINNLLLAGIKDADQEMNPMIINTEEDAVKYIVKNATYGSFVVFCTESVNASLNLIQKYLLDEEKMLVMEDQ